MVINSSIGSLHDDSDDLSFSQASSQTPFHQSWTVDKINSLQSDMATTKVHLDHLKTSMDTQISSLQTDLKADLTTQISALHSKVDSKIDTFQNEMRHNFDTFRNEMRHNFDTFRNEMRHNFSELRAESNQQMLGFRAESKQHEVRLVWRVFFAVSVILIFTIPY